MVRHFFARGNTARGVHCLYDSAFQGLRKIFLLNGLPGCGKSTLLQRIADDAAAQGQPADLFHSPLNPDELDALILPNLAVGIADGRTCEGLDSLDGVELVAVDLGQAVAADQLSDEARQEIESLHTQWAAALSKAYESFATALRIHDEWEAIYIKKMDFAKADQVGQELASALFGERSAAKEPKVRHLFFGAATPQGAVDHIQGLTSHLERRIFIKGRPGSGKSTLLKRLAKAAAESGLDVEVFHCGFDPNSLDMLIFPELSTAIFDSTAPHEYFPSQSSDEILDMYERAMEPGTDAEYAAELREIQQRYSQKMREATAYLQSAQAAHAAIKAHYVAVTDFALVDRLSLELLGELVVS
ncbi:MAG TPA: PRK06851 family protein [Symbiobacteriaceae bacterium]|nr:PRK06851 family protein [Symbiobacteriaceae bacterium]